MWMIGVKFFLEMLKQKISDAFPSGGGSGGLWNWNTYPGPHVYGVGWGLDVRWMQTGWGPIRPT